MEQANRENRDITLSRGKVCTVLLVDDEPNILRALMRLLRRDGYNILCANSGAEGLALLGEHDVDVIISDQRMPVMTGTEFLSRVKELYPDTVRIVLSGYTDLNTITEAINRGAIYKFLTKPWDDELLRDNVKQAVEQHELRAENHRLAEELRLANEALYRQVAEQDRELILHHRMLELSHQVLEQLPVGVVGVDDDGIIVLANSKVHEMLRMEEGALIGEEAVAALPEPLARICSAAVAEEYTPTAQIHLESSRAATVYCSAMSRRFGAGGHILLLMQHVDGG